MTHRISILSGRALALAGLVLLSACSRENEPRAEPIRPVRTLTISATADQLALSLPGEVRPRLETRYGFRVGGKLSARSVAVGDRVKAGAVLARLDPLDAAPQIAAQQAQLEAARTELNLARIDIGRTRELREKNFVSQSQLDRQQAVLDGALARVDAVQAQLEQARNAAAFQVLLADADGVVVAIEAEAGQVVSAGQPIVRIALARERDVLINVPEQDLSRVRQIERWLVSLPGAVAEPLVARLHEVSPLADPASRTYAVRLALSPEAAGVEWGMSAVVRGVRAAQPSFVIPLSALWSKDGQPHVWLLDAAASTVKPVPVQTAGLVDDGVRIGKGLAAGDVVVTAGANLLISGQRVRRLDGAPK